MSTRREEIELEIELLELEEKFLAAKERGENSRHPDRLGFSQARGYWRGIREVLGACPDGVAVDEWLTEMSALTDAPTPKKRKG